MEELVPNTKHDSNQSGNHEQQIDEDMVMSELKKIYWHEKQLLVAIPLLLKSATTFELVESLTILGQYTREHVKQLETNFPTISKVD